MSLEADDLTPEQWEALKALRRPHRRACPVNTWVLETLVAA